MTSMTDILQTLPVKVDMLILKDRLAEYKNPRKKVFDLVKEGSLFQIRRGHYINLKATDYSHTNAENLANIVYYPSYISLEWALQYYGLISERVHTVTSVTTRRSSQFSTPIAHFSYEHINKNRYPVGYVAQGAADSCYLIATPEKAIVDFVNLRTDKIPWRSDSAIATFLSDDLRLNLSELLRLLEPGNVRLLFSLYNRNSKEARLLRWLLTKKVEIHG